MDVVGVLIVTHGDFGKELLKSAELITGEQKRVEALSLNHGDNVEGLYSCVKEKIKQLDEGQGVIVLTDLFGGSPSNVTAANMKNKSFESLSGVNLPMLIEILDSRNTKDLKELTKKAHKAGAEGIKNIRSELELSADHEQEVD